MTRRARSSFVLFATLATVAGGSVAACSAAGDGDSDLAVEPTGADADLPDASVDATTPQRDATADRSSNVADVGADARDAASDAREAGGDADSGGPGAGDSGPVSYDPEGTPCSPDQTVQQRQCGRCGTEKRLCLGAADAGSRWLEWGPCIGEKPDAGLPGSTSSSPCEMCGTRTISWDNQCNAAIGFCVKPATSQCETGKTEYVPGLSCDAGLGRSRTCDDSCQWQPFGTCVAFTNPDRLVIPTTASQSTSSTFRYIDSPRLPRLIASTDLACPLGAGYPQTTSLVGYAYVEVHNPTTQTATVSLWHGTGDTQMAVYAGTTIPADDNARRNCLAGTQAVDNCPAQLAAECEGTGQYSTAGLYGVVIPPGGSIMVWNSPWSATGVATFVLSVRTESLN